MKLQLMHIGGLMLQPTKATALNGLTIVVTRPEHQQAALSRCIQSHGGKVLNIASMEIRPIALDSHFEEGLHILPSQVAIFVSANAVLHSKKLWRCIPRDNLPQILAIGEGTASALINNNLPVAAIPTLASSEGLTALPQLREVKDKIIYLCCGKDTRPMIAETLRERGAQVISIVCYERVPLFLSREQIQRLNAQPIHVVVTTSLAALTNWRNMLTAAKLESLLKAPVLVIHEKYEAIAAELGFSQIIISNGASDASVLAALVKYAQAIR